VSFKSLKKKSILVYCGSRDSVDAVFYRGIDKLVQNLADCEAKLIFGGSDVGLMHRLCDQAHQKGVPITGVIPQNLYKRGLAFKGCTELIVSESLHERKSKMEDLADGTICFPGGVGSLDEFLSAFAKKQMGESDMPLVLLNLNGYYRDLLALLENFVTAGFASNKIYEKFHIAQHVNEAFEILAQEIATKQSSQIQSKLNQRRKVPKPGCAGLSQ